MSKPDYYKILEVQETSTEDEIRKAYRNIAVKNHPDRNPGDPNAPSKMKLINEAYGVLSNSSTKIKYDTERQFRGGQFRYQVNINGRPQQPNIDIGAINDFFKKTGDNPFDNWFKSQKRTNPEKRGEDVLSSLVVSLEEALSGCWKIVPFESIRSNAPCRFCSGSGKEPGGKVSPCDTCSGNGTICSIRQGGMYVIACGVCGGLGVSSTILCKNCHGTGKFTLEKELKISVPAGVEHGQRLRIPGYGVPGNPPGDLYVDIQVQIHDKFERHQSGLSTTHRIKLIEAIRGTSIKIVLPDGFESEIKIPPGTQPGDTISMNGVGARIIGSNNRGILHITINVEIPKNMTEKAMGLLEEFEKETANP